MCIRDRSESSAESADATQRQTELIELIELCKPVQALLGSWHDCVVQLQILDDMEPAPEHEALRTAIAKMMMEQLAAIEQTVAGHPLFLNPGQANSSSRSVSGS